MTPRRRQPGHPAATWRDAKPGPPSRAPRSRPSSDAVRAALESILASREFYATDRVRAFLRYVVEETLAGRTDRLKGYTIAKAVFGRDDGFDPARDPVVRVQAGRLRQALERYYLVVGEDDPVRIDVPKGGYVPRFHERALPAYPASTPSERELPNGPSLAVLPFEDLTGGSAQSFFAVGLAADLTTELSRYQDLLVIPCPPAALPMASLADVGRFCRSAGARFLLGGTIRCDTESAKVSMQLIDGATSLQVWAHAYKRPLEAASLIRTQEEIARDVVGAIGSEYGVIARRLAAESRKKPPASLSTYEAMLRYHTYQIAPSPDASAACFAALHAAVEREPDYGPAWSALANLYCQMYVFDVAGFEEAVETGSRHARRGVALEPGRQVGRLVLAYAMLLTDDLAAFEEEAAVTLALNPANPYAAGAVGYLKVLAGAFDGGCQLLDRATHACPFHPQWFRHGYFLAHFHRKDYEAALDAVQDHDDVGFWQPVIVAAALGKLDRPVEAAPHVALLLERKPDFAGRARELLARSVKVEGLVVDLVDGLRKAGVPPPAERPAS